MKPPFLTGWSHLVELTLRRTMKEVGNGEVLTSAWNAELQSRAAPAGLKPHEFPGLT